MGRWKSKEERLKLGERAVYLRDVERLKWKDIAERLGLFSGTHAVIYYKKYKAVALAVKSEMSFRQIMEFSHQHRIEPGWVWLYENGFRYRVSLDVQEKIELAKMGIESVKKEAVSPFEKADGRRGPRMKGTAPILRERSY